MSNCKIMIQDVSDGNEVAKAIGLYVNSLVTPGEAFNVYMRQTDRNVQHNFTMLCMEWFRALAKTNNYDGRNEASRRYANIISYEMQCEQFVRQKMSAKGVESAFEFDYRSDESAVQLLERYTRLSKDNRDFIRTMLNYVHKTCQQSFSGMCCEWFKTAAELPARRKRFVLLARKAVKHYTQFPFI